MIKAKIMLLGDIGVGKTSIARRLVFDRFEADYKTTIGVDIQSCTVAADADTGIEETQLILWDTDGDFGSSIFTSVYIKGAAGAVIVADLTRPPTIEKLRHLAERFLTDFPGRPCMLVLNKTDLVGPEGGHTAVEGIPADHVFAASAKSGSGVREVFVQIAKELAFRR
ncbi:MAG: Rab family GTPase [Beijerinckiaceae bacterium]